MFDWLYDFFCWIFITPERFPNSAVGFLFIINCLLGIVMMVGSLVHYNEMYSENVQREDARRFFLGILGTISLLGISAVAAGYLLFIGGRKITKGFSAGSFIKFFRLAFTSEKPKKVKIPKAIARERG